LWHPGGVKVKANTWFGSMQLYLHVTCPCSLSLSANLVEYTRLVLFKKARHLNLQRKPKAALNEYQNALPQLQLSSAHNIDSIGQGYLLQCCKSLDACLEARHAQEFLSALKNFKVNTLASTV
jgi:hypothetical protein